MTAWTDDRLGAALKARAEGSPTPSDLVDATLRAVAERPIRTPWRLAAVPIGLAAIALVVVGGGVALFGGDLPATTPVPTATAEPSEVPASRFGLPVIDVFAALQVRDPDHDDRELAVSGWLTVLSRWGPICFPEDTSQGPLLSPVCRTDVVEGLLSMGADAQGPTMRVVLPKESLPADDSRGAPVVLYGHFDDRRARECANAPACASKFLVDAVEVDGELLGQRTVVVEDDGDPSPPPAWTTDDAIALAVDAVGDGAALLRVVQIESALIGELEPALVGRAPAAPWWWHVTVLDPASGRARTFAMADPLGAERNPEFYELLSDGEITSSTPEIRTGQLPTPRPVTTGEVTWNVACNRTSDADCDGAVELFANNLARSWIAIFEESGGRLALEPRACPTFNGLTARACWDVTAAPPRGSFCMVVARDATDPRYPDYFQIGGHDGSGRARGTRPGWPMCLDS